MADYEVTLGSDVYEFDAFADAIAKAQELGSDAVLTVYALPTEDLYTCGVTTVFDYDGEDTARSIFNGNSAAPGVTSATITFRHGGIGNLQGTGRGSYGTVTINMEGGYAKMIYGVAYGVSADNAIVNFSGGSTTYIIAVGNSNNVGSATVNITGGRADNVCAGRVVNGTLGPVTITMTGGFAGIFAGASMAGKTINAPVDVTVSGGTLNYFYSTFAASDHIGAVSLTMTGGTATGFVYGGSRVAGGTQQGDVTLSFSGDSYLVKDTFGSGYGTTTGNITLNFSDNVYVAGRVFGQCGHNAAADGEEVNGNVTINIAGGTFVGMVCGGGYANAVSGDTRINVSGGVFATAIYGGGLFTTTGTVGGSTYVSLTGGTFQQINAACATGALTGDSNLYIGAGAVFNNTVNAGGNAMTATIGGNINLVAEGAAIDANLFGDTRSPVAHDINMTITDSYVLAAAALGGDGTNHGSVGGDINVTVTGSQFGKMVEDERVGGTLAAVNHGLVEGNVAFTITNSTFLAGLTAGASTEGGEIKGNATVTVTDSSIRSIVRGAGTLTGTFTLNVIGTLTSAAVSGVDLLTLAAGATVISEMVLAPAVTATAAAEDGLYALATGFAAQDSIISVIDAAGVALGNVTLTEEITSGSFTVGSDTYNVGIADDTLYLGKNADIPTPTPPTPTATGAEVILTITDPNHDYKGATGGWKVQADQTVEWQDLTTLGEGYAYLGLGVTAAGKPMSDIYVYNADVKYIAAFVTDETGAISYFESVFLGENALMQVGLADFNADGVSDLLLRTADGFVGYYANGAFAEVQGLGTEWTVAALGDVDGNGCDDVIIAHEQGYVGAYLIGTDGSISWADLGNLDAATTIVGAGDVNGDGTDDVIVQVNSNYYGAWLCGAGAVTGFFGIGTFDAEVQDIADYNGDGKDDLLFRTASGVVGAALIADADTTSWAEYGALGAEWSTKGVGIL